jgi:shikimate dehydrogenase
LTLQTKYGLIGYPLGHSFSLPYFSRKFKKEGIGAVYSNYPLEEISRFTELVKGEEGLRGLNVTVPYKQQVIPFLDELDPLSSAIGAVNTIRFERRGSKLFLKGFNTDVTGFRKSLEEHLEGAHSHALVLGTGGSSKAVCYVLDQLGIPFRQVSRTRRSKILSYEMLDEDLLRRSRVIINTTPLGMHPHVDACPDLDYSLLGPEHLLFDLVYNPAVTLFLKRGTEMGAQTVNGHQMLVYQAEASWEIWNRKNMD